MKQAHQAVQAMGGAGYLSDNPVGRIFRDAKLMEIGAGTSEIRRMLVGREMLASMVENGKRDADPGWIDCPRT